MDDYKIIVEQENQTVMAHYDVEAKPAEGYQSEARLEHALIQQLCGQGYEYVQVKNEAALLAALESGKVRAAGLDVWAEEPSQNAALYNHPNVSCTPHIGAATGEAQKRIGTEIVSIIENF